MSNTTMVPQARTAEEMAVLQAAWSSREHWRRRQDGLWEEQASRTLATDAAMTSSLVLRGRTADQAEAALRVGEMWLTP